eukprot:s3857_g1.t1
MLPRHEDLPGVRELFETEIVPDAPRKTRKQLFQYIQPDYYGWRDEEDGMLVLAEQMFEEQSVKKAMENWTEPAPKTKKRKTKDEEKKAVAKEPEVEKPKEQDFKDFKAYVDVPTMEDIERMIVQKKKETLLKKSSFHHDVRLPIDQRPDGLLRGQKWPH